MDNLLRRAAGAGLISLVAIACGGAPAGSGLPTGLPSGLPTIPPIDVPSVSIVPDQSLEDLFPDTIGGNVIEVESASGASVGPFFNADDETEFNAFLTRIGAAADQVSAARSFHIWPGATASEFTGLTIVAVRVRGVPAANTLQSMVTVVQEDVENATVGTATLGGKTVTSITNPEDSNDNAYLYAVGDVTFLVGGTAAHVEEAFSQLP
jgi:hypothetical protein